MSLRGLTAISYSWLDYVHLNFASVVQRIGHLPSKQIMRVRFPLEAPLMTVEAKARILFTGKLRGSLVVEHYTSKSIYSVIEYRFVRLAFNQNRRVRLPLALPFSLLHIVALSSTG